MNKKIEKIGIKIGMSFAERSIGTNAIALSIRIKKPVYTTPLHNYCDLLRELYFYSVPLEVNKNDIGYLAICSLNEPVKVEFEVIANLTAYKLINEFKSNKISTILPDKMDCVLNKKQLNILRLIAMGVPDKTIALEEGITINTVKYHKKSIYKKLGVECSAQAVIKCLKLNLMSIDDIDC
ncbi:helix-turn-helix transcriptional regulator [Ruminiclostridium josui]|uniref:helix-turn-helix transcriptional regulator n=1 Tax=Ruminiclostridium josui TaxID=1499 RepID=UPI00046481D5|nr:helix-turn-helix transcriptional regulator [Ruminiclostridium josui]